MEGTDRQVDPNAAPSGTGCADCLAGAPPGWWLHLRRCAACGHIGCCDNSPSQHARHHADESGHLVIQSFEPGEDWFYDFGTDAFVVGAPLAEPRSHPAGQSVPGPRDRVPADWQSKLN